MPCDCCDSEDLQTYECDRCSGSFCGACHLQKSISCSDERHQRLGVAENDKRCPAHKPYAQYCGACYLQTTFEERGVLPCCFDRALEQAAADWEELLAYRASTAAMFQDEQE